MTNTSQYFYPPDSNVFALTNLPEVVKGALFSRYSRSPDSLKDILEKEFLVEGEEKAEAFYDRVLGAYGDDSVAELGGAHIAIEGVSDLVAQEILNSRIGISPLAKSTRYVDYGKAATPYFTPVYIAGDGSANQLYSVAMRCLYETYNNLLPRVVAALSQQSPWDKVNGSLPAYARATKAKALDLIRGLLPVGTLTNLGLFGNGRAYEYLIVKLNASDHMEAHEIARKLKIALDGTIAPFVKRSTEPRGQAYTNYLYQLKCSAQAELPPDLCAPLEFLRFWEQSTGAKVVRNSPYAVDAVIEGILYPEANKSFAEVSSYVADLDQETKAKLLVDYASGRTSRHQRPGRALELADYTFEICTDIGAYRDLHRHRLCTEIAQPITGELGYEISAELKALGDNISDDYRLALDGAKMAWIRLIERDFGHAADYLLPMAYRHRWLHKMNLREAVHLIELRSQPQGHISYRQIAWAMADEIARVTPLLASQLRFVERSAVDLGRLESEIKLEQKNENSEK